MPTNPDWPSKEWCLKMAELEGNAEIGAGMLNHPLRTEHTMTDEVSASEFLRDLEPHHITDGRGNPGLAYTGQNVVDAFKAGAILARQTRPASDGRDARYYFQKIATGSKDEFAIAAAKDGIKALQAATHITALEARPVGEDVERVAMKRSNCLSFEGGQLTIRLDGYLENGSGYFAAKDDDLDLDEEGYRSAKIPASEFVEIRDWLNEVIPDAALSRPPTYAQGIEEGLERAAKVAEVYSSIHVEKRDDQMASKNMEGALTKARQAQTCDEIAAAIRALKGTGA